MNNIKFSSLQNVKKIAAAVLSVILVFLYTGAWALTPAETAEAMYSGLDNSNIIINNISYADVMNSGSWAKEAIFETGALGILKGYGDKRFGLKDNITKEQAIAMVYRAIGREADAQMAAEALNQSKNKQDRKSNPVSVWADGYLQLAAADGLITLQDLSDAFNTDQTTLLPESFHRSAPAQRQEMAYWLAKALKLQPSYNQQKIFNSYSDWKSTDTDKIPYIETILANNIMNGDGKGNFAPKGPLTKEQAAQVLKNAEGFILPLLGLVKSTGTIEGIDRIKDNAGSNPVVRSIYDVRNSSGALHKIITEMPATLSGSFMNENNGSPSLTGIKDLIVYKDGSIGGSELLKSGDRIEYITGADNSVKFVKVISSIYDTRYAAAQINSIDMGSRLLDVQEYFNLNYADIALVGQNLSFGMDRRDINSKYRYSNNAEVVIDGRKAGIQDLKPGRDVILTIENGLVTRIETFEFKKDGENNVVKGIVEDNNPQLGYITLYGEDGSGTGPESLGLGLLRTYSYGNQNNLEIFKNHGKAEAEDIEVGDTVFLKLDDDLNVISASAVDNYTVKYGKVISKRASSMVVEYDNGDQQVLNIDNQVFVSADKKPSGYSRIKDGDRVRLLLHITNKFTKVKEISLEGSEHFISNIYKAKIAYIDDTSNKLIAQNLEVFNNGKWARTEQKGITSLELEDECPIYYDNNRIDISRINKYFRDNEAYIAAIKDYGGEERAAMISYRHQEDAEDEPYDDSVSTLNPASGEFALSKRMEKIKYGEGSIVVKDGRLVTGGSISQEDPAYVVANRSYDNGEYYAGIIQINDRAGSDFVQIYRGRIKQIDENQSFTLESFSQLKGLKWEFANTPKSFKLSYGTRLIDDSGIVSQRDFKDYGEGTFKNRTVYVIANGTEALLVSTAPYGTYNVKGEISDITGAQFGEEGTIIQEPTGLSVTAARVYDPGDYMWKDSGDMTLNIPVNGIILKNKEIIKPSGLEKGDRIRVIKKDGSETGDAYIIMVEN